MNYKNIVLTFTKNSHGNFSYINLNYFYSELRILESTLPDVLRNLVNFLSLLKVQVIIKMFQFLLHSFDYTCDCSFSFSEKKFFKIKLLKKIFTVFNVSGKIKWFIYFMHLNINVRRH